MRGDCKFSQTEYLDGWDALGVRFQFGYEVRTNLKENLIAQLSGGVRSLCAPVDNLESNCQILRHARKTIHRLLNWTNYTPAFFRLCAVLNL
jgi:hypothetical protein